ncbi:hypothetical protein DICPUDRAFT_100160 [Dictyostelium purpureum]|uniref:Anaphase-promoting complex subunit 4 n=1 Tax=Dictyostelium purpureum TaxID=5786 RepID=F1A639_DICPU|nr:uncharacterized protein DICPUDRAFT_100160 [Dictyostelium purpureum]EGC28340.1 hypothetical protein DICPUDRAFT_100160 [Dictyostelium purpureum]|eukprot:XP_003295133.1 hypothetical protein DICPUDRAFT_100160 [Dictyostelium purpureum]
MDLIALDNNNSNNGNNDISITSIVWSPNGKMIPVGCENGSVFIYSIENSKLISSSQYHKNKIHKLLWIKSLDNSNSNNKNSNGFNNNVSNLSFIEQIKNDMNLFPPISSYFDSSKEDSIYLGNDIYDRQFDLLLCCDSNGNISFLVFGIFKIVSIDLLSLIKSKYSSLHFLIKPAKSLNILDITLTESLNKLSIMIETDNGLLMSITLDTSILSLKKNEIHQVSLQYFLKSQLQISLDLHLKDIVSKWKDCQQQLTSKWNEFEKVLMDYGYSSSIEQELIGLLLTGVPSPPTHQFLINNINIKKLKTIETTYNSIREILIKFVLPSFLNIFHIVTLLHNNSLQSERFQSLLDQQLIKNTLDYCGSFGMKLHNLETVICGIEANFSSFTSWLYKTQCFLNEMQPDRKILQPFNELLIMSLLKKGLKQDLLFSLASNSSPSSTTSSPKNVNTSTSQLLSPYKFNSRSDSLNNSFSSSNSSDSSIDFQFKDIISNSFFDCYKEFKNKTLEIFSNEITKSLSNSFKIENIIPICLYDKNDTSVSHKFNCSLISHPNDLIYIGFNTTLSMSNRLFIAKRESKSKWSFTCFQLEESLGIQDLKFYNQQSIMATVSQDIIKSNQKKSSRKNTFLKQYQYNKTEDDDTEFEEKEYKKLDVNIPPSTILLDLLDTVFSCQVEDSFKSREIIAKSRISPITLELSTSRRIAAYVTRKKRKIILYELAEDERR